MKSKKKMQSKNNVLTLVYTMEIKK